MKIWKLGTDANHYDNITFTNEEDWSLLLFDNKYPFDGRRLADLWTPLKIEIIEVRKESDTPSLSPGVPILSERALKILGDLLKGSVEILPLNSTHGRYSAINVVDVVDCVDYDKAKFTRFKSSGRIMKFEKYVFKSELVKNKNIFKIVDETRRSPFVSDEFRDRVLENGLRGFDFQLVWDSDQQ